MLLRNILLGLFLPACLAIDPFTAGSGIGLSIVASAMWSSINTFGCFFKECCKEPYIRTNLVDLKEKLDENVFGQHIVLDIIKFLKSHLQKDTPKKSLVLSFHGWTGSGKNYVAQFIAESIFKEGMKSKYVHHFFSSVHFSRSDRVDQYKSDIQSWLRGNVSDCKRNLFIFDEIDKMPPGVIDALKPYLDHHEAVDGVDYRKSIFIFLSNTGGNDISSTTFKHWKSGKKRESLTFLDLDHVLSTNAYNELGGLQNADVIDKSLVDVFVPFLPLEKTHVKKCISREFERRKTEALDKIEKAQETEKSNIFLPKWNEEDVQSLADKLTYMPPDSKIFSKTGCKKVSQLIDHFLEDQQGFQW